MVVVGWAGSRGTVGGAAEEAEGVAEGVVSTDEWEVRSGAILPKQKKFAKHYGHTHSGDVIEGCG